MGILLRFAGSEHYCMTTLKKRVVTFEDETAYPHKAKVRKTLTIDWRREVGLRCDPSAIGPLVALLRHGRQESKASAAVELGKLANNNANNKAAIAAAGAIPPLIQLVCS